MDRDGWERSRWRKYQVEWREKKERKERKEREKEREKMKERKRERREKEKWEERKGRRERKIRVDLQHSNEWNSSDQEVNSVYSTKAMLQEVRILPTLVYFHHKGLFVSGFWDWFSIGKLRDFGPMLFIEVVASIVNLILGF